MNITEELFTTSNGNSAYKIDMFSSKSLHATFLTLGASIQKIAFIDSQETEHILTLTYKNTEAYENCLEYAGMTIGPNAGRVRNSNFSFDKIAPSLVYNEPTSSLHGGPHNLSTQNWKITDLHQTDDLAVLSLCTSLPDRLDGWPGNRTFQVTYSLSDTALSIDYFATTDKETYINMTNHTYWNLTENPEMALEQVLTIPASNVCRNAKDHFPEALEKVSANTFDFRTEQPIKSPNLNHGFLFDSPRQSHCQLRDSKSGRALLVTTDAPGIIIYSGKYILPGNILQNSFLSAPNCAIALEAQEFPTVCPYTLTTPLHPFKRKIEFQFLF